jgi:hypothetical protein
MRSTLTTTAKEINEINREFWARQNVLMEQRMADDAVRQVALARVESECSRGVPINKQVSLVAALEEAETNRGIFLSQLARKGGRAQKLDALQELIVGYVRRISDITEPKLQDMLTRDRHPAVISDIVDGKIEFNDRNGRAKSAPISGLKDRLYRAKKMVRSR